MGGGYLFVTKPQIGRSALASAIEEVRKNYPDANIEYANYFHGDAANGARTRQNLAKGFVAEEMKKGGGFLYQDNRGNFRVGEFSTVVSGSEAGMLFNQATGEILVS